MSFTPNQARVFFGLAQVRQAAHAFAKTSRPLALVASGYEGAQLAAAINAARLPGMLRAVVVEADSAEAVDRELYQGYGVDVVFALAAADLATGSTVLRDSFSSDASGNDASGDGAFALSGMPGWEDSSVRATQLLRQVGLTNAKTLLVSDDEYPALWQAQRAAADLGIDVTVMRVPVPRRPDGTPTVRPSSEDAIAVGAALAGAAMVAEQGPEKVVEFAEQVAPEAQFRAVGMDLGPAPQLGEGLLFASLGDVRDVMAIPFGIGVRDPETGDQPENQGAV